MGPLKKKNSSFPSSLKTKSDIIFYVLGRSGADHVCSCSRKATGLGDQGLGPALILTGYLTVG